MSIRCTRWRTRSSSSRRLSSGKLKASRGWLIRGAEKREEPGDDNDDSRSVHTVVPHELESAWEEDQEQTTQEQFPPSKQQQDQGGHERREQGMGTGTNAYWQTRRRMTKESSRSKKAGP